MGVELRFEFPGGKAYEAPRLRKPALHTGVPDWDESDRPCLAPRARNKAHMQRY